MNLAIEQDLWEYLATTDKTVVMYGMGNGADKILRACSEKGIAVQGFFASDGFVRGHLFHGHPVLSWSEIKAKYGAEKVIVLLSFGTSRPEVLENILRIASEAELYAPDVPAFGDGLFDRAFYETHQAEIEQVYAMLSDEESRRIYENVLRFKLTGDVACLMRAESNADEVFDRLIEPKRLHAAADLGAYNGDTVRELLARAEGGELETVYAMEPDARNFRKLEAYAKDETRAAVQVWQAGAWSESARLCFDASGNRNASLGSSRSETLADRPMKVTEIQAEPLDEILGGARVDYIKYDVEGAEREALLGSRRTIEHWKPTLMVSLYHRNEDLFTLPLLIRDTFGQYRQFYLRRFRGVPAWDLNLYCK